MHRIIITGWVIFACLLLAGCQSSVPTPTLTLVPSTSTPILTTPPTPIPTLTPASTPTVLPTITPSPEPTRTPFLGRSIADVTYCTVNGDALKMDMYFPKGLPQQPMPVALNIHGGSWSAGDKKENETSRDFSAFTNHGYVVAAVNYRHAPTHKFPAQIEDVKCAVRFLRANANKYNIDSNRIGAFGCSAGGHLASMLGLANNSAGFDNGGEYASYSSRVQAVIAMSAPTDLTLYDPSRFDMLQRVFGAKSMTDTILTTYSPVTYVTANSPPFLIISGDQDIVVPLRQSKELYDRLKAKSDHVQLLIVQNGDHCLLSKDTPMIPSRDQVTQRMVSFFDQTLPK